MVLRTLMCALVVVLTAAVGCGNKNKCVEGSVRSCPCGDGAEGTQSCGDDGTYGACSCGPNAGNTSFANECGGVQDLRLDGEDVSPGDSCGVCDDGVVACDGPEAFTCVLSSEPNECGGCEPLRNVVGEPCDDCGGVWACSGTDALLCDSDVEPNACGGCSDLGGESPLFTCDVGGSTGVLYCREPDQLVCVGATGNACGGDGSLEELPTIECGRCGKGKWVCESADAVRCENGDAGVNACGGCAVLPHELGESCDCGGTWECGGADSVRCSGINTCGRCAAEPLEGQPGESCGPSKIWACSDEGVECVSDDRNPCGGSESLGLVPGDVCGECNDGVVLCVAPNTVACAGATERNGCGGCGSLAAAPSTPCGHGYGRRWVCDGEDSVKCESDPSSAVCGEPGMTPGDPCGEQCGVYACTIDGTIGCFGERDLMTDEANCGGCGAEYACGDDQVCLGGECIDERAVQVATGEKHTCVLFSTGRVECWGENSGGQLGTGDREDSLVPVELVNAPELTQLDAGADHTCGVTAAGALGCWGKVPDGSTAPNSVTTFTTVAGLPGPVARFSAGYRHSCAALENGELYCWGLNSRGALGDGTTDDQSNPVKVAQLDDVEDVAVGGDSTCAVVSGGSVYCWGSNDDGQLGQGSEGGEEHFPVEVLGVTAERIVGSKLGPSAFNSHYCTVNQGSVVCWGANGWKQVAPSGTTNSPTLVSGLPSVTAAAVGRRHSCVLAGGEVHCWGGSPRITGSNDGEVGNGDFDGTATPVVVDIGGQVDDLATGFTHTCATTDVGDVYCWGKNTSGQLGDLQSSNRATPVRVPTIGAPSELGRCTNGMDDDDDGDVDCLDVECAEVLDSSTLNGTFVGAPDYFELMPGCDDAGSPDRAFRWTAPDIGTFEFATFGSDAAIEVRTANCTDGVTAVCDDSSGSSVSVPVTQVGEQYIVIVEKRDSDSFSLTVSN